jgi:hypothetical protein
MRVTNTPDGFLNLRSEPNARSNILLELKPGQLVYADATDCSADCNTNWAHVVALNKTIGFVATRYLKGVPMSACNMRNGFPNAAGPTIPSEFHGTWCNNEITDINLERGNQQLDFVRLSCESTGKSGFDIEVTGNGIDMHNGDMFCSPIGKVQPYMTNEIRKGIRNPWGPAYRIKFRCGYEGDSFITKTWSWQIVKEYLRMEVK